MKHHISETNKMSDTPRTDARRGFHGWYTAVDAEFSEKLERELNAAHDRMQRLEEVGDEMARWLSNSRNLGDDPFLSHKWRKAKEAKL